MGHSGEQQVNSTHRTGRDKPRPPGMAAVLRTRGRRYPEEGAFDPPITFPERDWSTGVREEAAPTC